MSPAWQSLLTKKWRGDLRPLSLEATHGYHGHGVYLTPSFRMAASYAFRSWTSGERFSKRGPAGSHFLVVLMCLVPQGKFREAPGSAFSHNTDGWNTIKIEWVVPNPKDAVMKQYVEVGEVRYVTAATMKTLRKEFHLVCAIA